MAWWKKGCLSVVLGLVLFVLAFWLVYGGADEQLDGQVTGTPLAAEHVAARAAGQARAAPDANRILFGDLHVHTTLSVDAFMWSLPLMGGEGVHPPADACDFARFCSQLDFYALTDHAEALNPRTWEMTRESVRQCNAVAAQSEQPDVIAFTGFEWTQVGLTPEEHYGHKNVLFKYDTDDQLPARPIAAPGITDRAFSKLSALWPLLTVPARAFPNQQSYLDFARHIRENGRYPVCPEGVDSRDLPVNCRERASSPDVLFDKLHDWGLDTLVIPHGTTWGFYTPLGYTWDKQLRADLDDESLQRLVEVFSGHGNSEEYREFRSAIVTEDGLECPEPVEGYHACRWRAGEVIRARCEDPTSEACERRVEKARADYLRVGLAGHVTLPGEDVPDWQMCGQCTDCYLPAYQYRPGGSVQYILAKGDFENPNEPRHATMGFIASSDNHTARPGTGYKEFGRLRMTEARGAPDEAWRSSMFGDRGRPDPESISYTIDTLMERPPFELMWMERQASFFITGGLVAVHAEERTREAIWDAMQARNVYGTSGDRILLWFDLKNGPAGPLPMGSELELDATPTFEVRAAGSFEQKPGCPPDVVEALGQERIQHICVGECYNPGDRRRRITRIEVIRITRQQQEDEPIAELIEDPWMTIPCPEGPDLCVVEFDDPTYAERGRDVLYYVRAIQEPTPTVNGGGLRCDREGCKPCYGNYRTPPEDDCLVDAEERAWSSPIFLSSGSSQ
ncbi:MAG: DUF3604 domain-containing protein [Deltaproteobacteria bacterium]|nr:DUF3604 domain-containing protein [Deltaproteobacteria bacterium]